MKISIDVGNNSIRSLLTVIRLELTIASSSNSLAHHVVSRNIVGGVLSILELLPRKKAENRTEAEDGVSHLGEIIRLGASPGNASDVVGDNLAKLLHQTGQLETLHSFNPLRQSSV